ncbi:MAG: hypothetical protein ACFFBX_00835 [Promethearchaeota archaeon]
MYLEKMDFGLSMSTWKVTLVEGPMRKFYDLQKVLNQYYELKPEWIKKLQLQIREQPVYNVHLNLIKSVQGPQGQNLLAPFLLLLITKTQLTVTYLGELTEDDTGYLIGIWPKKFLKILKSDEKAILNLLFVIIEYPQLMEKIDLFF